MRKNPLIWLALVVVLAGTAIGLQGHFWIAIVADFAAIALAVGAKLLAKVRGRAERPRNGD
jgi:hypothetical protein